MEIIVIIIYLYVQFLLMITNNALFLNIPKGYSVINIAASDFSNGLIGFEESSKNIRVNEDLSSVVTLKLIRLNAFFGEVKVRCR